TAYLENIGENPTLRDPYLFFETISEITVDFLVDILHALLFSLDQKNIPKLGFLRKDKDTPVVLLLKKFPYPFVRKDEVLFPAGKPVWLKWLSLLFIQFQKNDPVFRHTPDSMP